MTPLPTRSRFSALAALAVCAAFAGCATSPPPVYYTLDDAALSALPGAAASGASMRPTPTVVVLPAELPEALDRPQLVARQSDNRLDISERRRWAAPLRREIPRVVAEELGRRLGSSGVVALPHVPDAPLPDYRLTLSIARLDAIPGQGVRLDAHWRLQARDGTVRNGRSAFDEPLAASEAHKDETGEAPYVALVAAHSRALRRLAGDIAQNVPR